MAEPAFVEQPLETLPLTPSVGAEVAGIDLAGNLSDGIIAWLSEQLVEHKVLFFREQHISVQQHITFARRFGELEVHPFSPQHRDHPEVLLLRNDREHPPYINVWHSDVTWRQAPSLGSILRARKVPAVGGDTLFANMEAAYDGLDEGMKARLEGLIAVHDNENFLAGMKARGASDAEVQAKREEFPPMRHPVVRTHPVSGRKSLYVNRAFTRSIEGMSEDAGHALLKTLFQTAWRPEVQCRFRWRPDSLAFWDNRAVQHYAAADYWPEERHMERVTIVGDAPF